MKAGILNKTFSFSELFFDIVEFAEGGEIEKQKLDEFNERFVAYGKSKSPWLENLAIKFKNFDITKDHLTKTEYEEIAYYLKKMRPLHGILENEHIASVLRRHEQHGESKLVNEIYYMNTEVLSRYDGYIKRIDALAKAYPVKDPLVKEWLADYRQKLVDFTPAAHKWTAMKERIMKREPKSVAVQKRHEEIKGSMNEEIKKALQEIAEGFRVEIEKTHANYYHSVIKEYKAKIIETGKTDPSDVYQTNYRQINYDNRVARSKAQTMMRFLDIAERGENKLVDGAWRQEIKYKLKQNLDEIIQKKAKEESELVIANFVYKMTDKLGGLLSKINKKVIVTKQGGLNLNRIKFDFEDGSKFTVQNNIVAAHSVYGTPFYRYPTTFHDAVLPNGEKVKNPSELAVKKAFNITT